MPRGGCSEHLNIALGLAGILSGIVLNILDANRGSVLDRKKDDDADAEMKEPMSSSINDDDERTGLLSHDTSNVYE